MKFRKTLGGLAATLSLGLTLAATPAATATTLPQTQPAIAVAAKTVSVPKCSGAKTATSKATLGTPPKGYFAVATSGSFRSGEANHCSFMKVGKAYTYKPFTTRIAGNLTFGTKSDAEDFAVIKPGKKTTVVEIYFFPNSQKTAVLDQLDKFERVKANPATGKSAKKWYVRKTVVYNVYTVSPTPLLATAQTYFAGSKYKEVIKGSECTVKNGDYKKRFDKGNGCR